MATLSRRTFMGVTGASAAAWALSDAHGQATRRPNVILMLSDDQGSVDVGCYGASDLHTPNLDALAARGVRFTSSYVAASVCSPSRGALLTGRYPRRNGLETNAGGETGLPESEIILPQLFKAAGYHTAVFGKWHLGMRESMAPTARGFDEFFGHKEGCIDNYSHFFYWHGPNRHDLWRNTERVREDGAFFPDLMTREALRFIGEHQQEPFFLYLPYNFPHYPMQAKPEFDALYRDMTEGPRRYYAASVSNLDACIGKIIEQVDALGLRDNTIILFLSDNGHSVEERAFMGGGSAGGFKGHKFTLWEGGIRTPCIVSRPGFIPEAEVREQVISSMDWLPTLMQYCSLAPPDCLLDGRDLSAVIQDSNNPSPHKALHWMLNEHWAVRKGPWKLVCKAPDTGSDDDDKTYDSGFLCNLDEDPGETRNLAPVYPEIRKELLHLHQQWAGTTR